LNERSDENGLSGRIEEVTHEQMHPNKMDKVEDEQKKGKGMKKR